MIGANDSGNPAVAAAARNALAAVTQYGHRSDQFLAASAEFVAACQQ
jgi:hypothetical protein